jgi:D-aspartate ligase
MVRIVNGLVDEFAGETLLLFGAADWFVEEIVRNRHRLSPRLVIPYPDAETVSRATDKVAFGEATAQMGVPFPETVVASLERPVEELGELPYPVVAKAASTSGFHSVEFPGKQKVYYADDEETLRTHLVEAREAGYRGEFLIQRRIRGGDDHMRVATCFAGAGGVEEAVVGRVLLEEHTPGAQGNPAVILVEPFPDIEEGARRLAEGLEWRGHANFDVKWDPDTRRHVFFELNPRLGRSNYYLTAWGRSPVPALMREYVPDAVPFLRRHRGRRRAYSILPAPLILRYVRGRMFWRVLGLWLTGRLAHPLWSWRDPSPRRWLYVQAYKLNQYRKFAHHFPPGQARMDA